MMKMFKMMMLMSVISGTLITSSAYSWMGMWMGMEINLLCIIPLMYKNKNYYSSESSIKYFIIQALASTLFMFSILTSSMLNEMSTQSIILMNISMFTKMGTAPFHFWLPEIIEGLSWMNCLIMLTWQKLAPLLVLTVSMQYKSLLITVIIVSMMIGGIMGMNQTNMKKILTYSSINHMGWMLSAFTENQAIGLIYFLIYSFISMNIILAMNKMNILSINQMIYKNSMNITSKISMSMNFMSLGGLPPMLGFYPKWMTLNSIVSSNQMTISIIMVMATLITLYFYMRIVILMMLTSPSKTSTMSFYSNTFLMNIFNSINLMTLPICTLWLNLT